MEKTFPNTFGFNMKLNWIKFGGHKYLYKKHKPADKSFVIWDVLFASLMKNPLTICLLHTQTHMHIYIYIYIMQLEENSNLVKSSL